MVYEKVWSAARANTNSRQGFRFTRTLWFGFGKNQGVRKVLHDAPRMVATALIGKLGGLVAAPIVVRVATRIEESVKEVAGKIARRVRILAWILRRRS